MKHDQSLCKCGTDREETPEGPACKCLCERCTVLRTNQMQLWRCMSLQKRLKKAGIDHEDLAFLMWLTVQDQLEAEIEKIAIAKVNALLKNLTLISQVKR